MPLFKFSELTNTFCLEQNLQSQGGRRKPTPISSWTGGFAFEGSGLLGNLRVFDGVRQGFYARVIK